MEIFPSKIDTWLLVLLLLIILIAIGSCIHLLRNKNLVSYLSALILVAIGAVMPAWLLLSTKYVVADDELIIHSGPRLWRIPLAEISSVDNTNNSRSSPALSLDRLHIRYSNGKSVMISPKDKRRFRAAIGQAE